MTDKTKKVVAIVGGCAVAAGTVAVCIATGKPEQAADIVTLTGIAFAAVGAVLIAIFKKGK